MACRVIQELKVKHGEEYRRWMAGTDNGDSGDRESRAKLRARSLAVFQRIAETEEGKKLPGIPNASVSVVQYDAQSNCWEFVLTGYDAHLKELGGMLVE